MMSNLVNVNAIAETVTKGTTPTSIGYNFSSEGIPFLRVNNIQEGRLDIKNVLFIDSETNKALSRSVIQSNDVLLSIAGTIGRSAVVPSNSPMMNCNQAVAIIRLSKKVDPHYFCLWLNSDGAFRQIAGSKVTGTISNLSLGCIKKLKIPLPPLEEQKRIAAILDKADAIRRSLFDAIALTEELLRSTFLDMFGNPVTNPKRWKTGKLHEVCDRITDGTHQSPKWSTEGVPFLFVSNIIDGEIDFHVSKYITEECWASLTKRCPIELDDILYTTVGSYGNAALIRTTKKFCFQRHIAHIKPNHDKVNPGFLLSLMQSPGIKNQADIQARGVAQKTLNLRELKEFEIFVPPRSEQDKYVSIKRKIESSLTSYRKCCDTQDNLFNSLLQKAFRGEL